MTRRAVFCRSCNLSIWTSAALMVHILLYSGTMIVLRCWGLVSLIGRQFDESDSVFYRLVTLVYGTVPQRLFVGQK